MTTALSTAMDGTTTDDMLRLQTKFYDESGATIDGMLGGLGQLDPADCSGSKSFIDKNFPDKDERSKMRVLDVGAGIGRVTKNVLIPVGFGTVDLLEMCQRFLDEAVTFVASPRLGQRYCSPMNKFDFCNGEQDWDLIWYCDILSHDTILQ
eukprot:m.729796 g.729796  ORF g.729796 m.729796 type:complete len:151 (+) comp23050_c0_seq40:254-706(+)